MTETTGTDSRPAPLVVLSGVNNHFGAPHGLQDIDLEITRGEVVVLTGQSGSGNSTLCRTINRLGTGHSGPIARHRRPLPAEGRELAQLRAEVRIGFQSSNLFAPKTVLEHVGLA
ncbi:ATP-binding cassette domain-containing protein, partial [Saccharothrix sp. ST-888]|uniref:ATP-binding cassette domain-containing protein n=1 Tax=Saccharothrix sp. ST-888 TaxID=1427391 RepID=UPI0005ECD0E8